MCSSARSLLAAGAWRYWGDSVRKFAFKSTFGHTFLKNLSIARKFLVVFAVLMLSLGAVGMVSMFGMREILGTFGRAADAYEASKLASQLESSASRVIAQQNAYQRSGNEAQAHSVRSGLTAMREHAAKLQELTAGTAEADKVAKMAGVIEENA